MSTHRQDIIRQMRGTGGVPHATTNPARKGSQGESFRSLSASELYCAKCKRSMPVREKLLLALPRGDLYDYLCTGCGSSLGKKTD